MAQNLGEFGGVWGSLGAFRDGPSTARSGGHVRVVAKRKRIKTVKEKGSKRVNIAMFLCERC